MQMMVTNPIIPPNSMLSNKPRAFTLIELLVVVSIIALLVSILLPALGKARDQAKRVVCAAQMHQTGIGSLMYTEDFDGKFPYGNWFNYPFATERLDTLRSLDTQHVGQAMMDYVDDVVKMLYCPASGLIKTEAYKLCVEEKNEFIHAGGGNDHIGFLYFGNMVTSTNGMIMYLSYDERQAYEEQSIYPRNTNCKRAILFADIVTDHSYGSNHAYPNFLYTDGSVEGHPEESLEIHTRPGGNWYKW